MSMKIHLDLKSGVPFYRQIIDQVKSAMATGRLEPGNRLPTVRQLAVDLSVNPNTVSRAYTELELTGLVETHMGSGTFVGQKKVEQDDVERRRILDEICQEFLVSGLLSRIYSRRHFGEPRAAEEPLRKERSHEKAKCSVRTRSAGTIRNEFSRRLPLWSHQHVWSYSRCVSWASSSI